MFIALPGALFDKNIRHPMDNPIFRKLQEAIERPCRSKEWFPLAEQAINTIYGLGERPDVLCETLIKNLNRRAFGKKGSQPSSRNQSQTADQSMDVDEGDGNDNAGHKTNEAEGDESGTSAEEKDVGDAFELAQLLFVVGHVAIKHIVFLELAERELKGQKNDKETGTLSPVSCTR